METKSLKSQILMWQLFIPTFVSIITIVPMKLMELSEIINYLLGGTLGVTIIFCLFKVISLTKQEEILKSMALPERKEPETKE